MLCSWGNHNYWKTSCVSSEILTKLKENVNHTVIKRINQLYTANVWVTIIKWSAISTKDEWGHGLLCRVQHAHNNNTITGPHGQWEQVEAKVIPTVQDSILGVVQHLYIDKMKGLQCQYTVLNYYHMCKFAERNEGHRKMKHSIKLRRQTKLGRENKVKQHLVIYYYKDKILPEN